MKLIFCRGSSGDLADRSEILGPPVSRADDSSRGLQPTVVGPFKAVEASPAVKGPAGAKVAYAAPEKGGLLAFS